MEKIVYGGDEYYYHRGKVYDCSYVELNSGEAEEVLRDFYGKVDFSDQTEEQHFVFISDLKAARFYTKCLDVIFDRIKNHELSPGYMKRVFPIITSCYRNLNQPQKAIDFWMENKEIYRYSLSVPLLTSLAAAYCDVKDYKNATYCADKAYALQRGGTGEKNELSLVYKRIQKETE